MAGFQVTLNGRFWVSPEGKVERCEESGWLVASWDAPGGGITTQGKDLRELQDQVRDAVHCHFDPGEVPRRIRLHFVNDPVLVEA